MKYGENFEAQSVPQWRAYNVDYNALKHLLKVNTSKNQGQAVAIPGHVDSALRRFEEKFFEELVNQHDRVELFVSSKADEISRRLHFLEKVITRLLQRCANTTGKPMSQKRREKFAKYDNQIIKCGDDIKNLQRFITAQRTAFYKILKKYRKWTGSRSLGVRFNSEVLDDPKSFTKTDLEPLVSQYSNILAILRSSTPESSEPATPRTISLSSDSQIQSQPPPQAAYWNEYDDGSEAGDNDPYTIYVNSDSTFPGAKMVELLVSRARVPMEKVKAWLSPVQSPGERRPLLGSGGGYFAQQPSALDTDMEDEAYASSSDFPSGYVAHYATFPSVSDQKYIRYREKVLFRTCLGSFGAAFVLLLVAGLLVATGRRRLRVEVDCGVITGVVASVFFAIMGFACMLARTETLGWMHRTCVVVTLATICILNGMLLVLVAGNTGL
ncbi:Uncharacterized protein LHYA1_G008723 [Lachnellula hyalina]|uniref:SPX domain-containing protein n=1 Tax=Lachnellula hyalina TaxID=1316788 RepID=A0A8H8QT55_9HELO|nr:Uncharacterized protein LHYA1_G008723 [Lachnellula hyalina]TVY22307.1 Uncharacterized protein LHYA1_G008723 [Lachnellula hyalina]